MRPNLDLVRWKEEARNRAATCRLRLAEWNHAVLDDLREGAIVAGDVSGSTVLSQLIAHSSQDFNDALASSLQPILKILPEHWDCLDSPDKLPKQDATRARRLCSHVEHLAQTILYVHALDADIATLITGLSYVRMNSLQLVTRDVVEAWASRVPVVFQRANQVEWWRSRIESVVPNVETRLGPSLWLSTLEG